MVHLAPASWLCYWGPGAASVVQFTAENGFSFIYSQEADAVYKVHAFDKIKRLESERSCSDLSALLLLTQMPVYGQAVFFLMNGRMLAFINYFKNIFLQVQVIDSSLKVLKENGSLLHKMTMHLDWSFPLVLLSQVPSILKCFLIYIIFFIHSQNSNGKLP